MLKLPRICACICACAVLLLSGCKKSQPTPIAARPRVLPPSQGDDRRAPAGDVTGVPAGMVAFFMKKSCPAGWKEMVAARGRLLLATTDSARVGKTSGEPLKNPTAPTHDHTFTASVDLGSKAIGAASGGGNDNGASSGTHRTSGTTSPASSNLPFMQLVVCEKQAVAGSVKDGFPIEATSLFRSKRCPRGWTGFSKADRIDPNGRFIVPLMQNGKLGAAVGEPWLASPPRHEHGITGSINVGSWNFAAFGGGNKSIGKSGSHGFNGKTAQSDPLAPFIELLICKKKAMSEGGSVPAGTVMFMGWNTCPNGWSETLASAGRFLVGLPEGGATTATFGGDPLKAQESRTHQHDFEARFSLPAHKLAIVSGCCRRGFAKQGTCTDKGKTAAVAAGLPYIQLRHCTKD